VHSDDFDNRDALCRLFLPFVREVRQFVQSSGQIEKKRQLAEKALVYLDLLEPAFKRQGGLAIKGRHRVHRFRTSPLSVCDSEDELGELLREAAQQIEAIALLMDVGSPRKLQ
jgi:hypothetical protein